MVGAVDCMSSGHSRVKAVICFPLCDWPCVCVWQSAVYFSASAVFFLADYKESGNGPFCAASTLTGVPFAANNCHYGLYFLSFIVILIYISFLVMTCFSMFSC